jgi:hypothetical protein
MLKEGSLYFFGRILRSQDGMASHAALSTHDEGRGEQVNAFRRHLLQFK